jgi:hypothetical protein
MAAEIILLNANDFTSQTYGEQDVNLISTFDVNTSFTTSSYVEFFIYDNNQNILSTTYNFTQYTVLNDGQSPGTNNDLSQIEINPEENLINLGYDQGQYTTYYNFFNKQVGSDLQQLYISEISSDRTEIRLDSTSLTNTDIVEQANSLIQQREDSPYFLDFYLNFGDNQLAIANNIQLDDQDPNNPTILIKLYEALPNEFDLNSTLWIVTLLEESIAYQVTFEDTPIIISDTIPVKGPNFNLEIKDQINNSTVSLDYSQLTTTLLTSSFNQLSSLLEEKEIDINIDYTDFSNFTHFSSVKSRLENFYYKVELIEQYSSSIATLNNTTNNNPSSNIEIYEAKINDIITNFDGYDYYLYYASGSWAWPKTTSLPPYSLATSTSPEVLTWFGSDNEYSQYYGGIILSASIFDNNNQNNLYYAIPEYLREDPANDQYQLFIEMVGQFYDNIWIYYKDVTEKYNADNRLENGISKDIVADAIRDFGIKLYQNNFSNEDLYTAFLGLTPDGALFPFPNITGSLPTPSGFEYVDTLISASNDYMPLDDVNKSLYKRIYHNLPYLLKAKGTLPALRTLITSYGISDTILRINEYGGKDKVNSNDWDFWQNTFNYAFYTTGSNYVKTTFNPVNSDWNTNDSSPDSISFRFKTNGLPKTNIPYSQSLWNVEGNRLHLTLKYTGSGYQSGSYQGSTIDPYYQYAHLEFYPSYTTNPTISCSIYLPFFDGEWWSVMVNREGNNFNLLTGNNVYKEGNNGTSIGFFTTSSAVANDIDWKINGSSYFGNGNVTINNKLYNSFSGSLQEIRYFKSPLKENVFKDYIMNPYSIEGNQLTSSPDELIFRASLGGELYTGSNSIHPKVSGDWITTSSFALDSSLSFGVDPTFNPNTEYFFYDQPAVGIKNPVSDKIRLENSVIPYGNTLSPFRSLAQEISISQSYTSNTNLLEVAFSPQDEINDDISSQLGYFNIGEYIGDPRLRSSSAESYPALDKLRNDYFEKYTSNYDFVDYIRLIKFFDNSLFKMIRDFVPARTSLASGIVIKQHFLERNKYPQPQVDNYSTIAYTTSGSQNNLPFTTQNISVSGTIAPQWNDYNEGTIENFSGGTGGSFEIFNYVSNTSQSWYETVPSPLGFVTTLHNDQDEFYDGEFSGSILVVTTQSLFQSYPLENKSFNYTPVIYSNYYYEVNDFNNPFTQNQFLNPLTIPSKGEILFLLPYTPAKYQNSPSYIKIHKIDKNDVDNSIALSQITNLVIQYTANVPSWDTISIIDITEYPTYYLYKIVPTSPSDNYIKNYAVSASSANSPGGVLPTVSTPLSNFSTTIGNTTGYFNSLLGTYSLGNTPNVTLYITGTLELQGTGDAKFDIILLRQGSTTTLNSTIVPVGSSVSISTTHYGLGEDKLYLAVTRGGGSPQLRKSNFTITQSISPNAPEIDPVILEPYITTPNFYYSDFNPTMNNVENERLSTKYEEVDYYPGITTPINFDLLISGSALKAAVQDSNYTSKRIINPRYNGVKSTNKLLNVWTPGDTGTYGKTPSTQNLKTMVAYCDWISGWPSERMNASAVHILYLIKSDGSVVIPNTSENSLFDNKGTFESGERIIIESKTISSGQPTQYRDVIRGGTRIEPILYTQYKSGPDIQWNTTMSFTDTLPPSTTANADYTSQFLVAQTPLINANGSVNTVILSTAVHGASYKNGNGYQIPLGAVQDAVSLTYNGWLNINLSQPPIGSIEYNVKLSIWKNTTQLWYQNYPNQTNGGNYYVSYTQNTNFTVGDIYYLKVEVSENTWLFNGKYKILGGSFTINQYPIYTPPVPITPGVNSIWQYYDSSSYPNVITSSTPELTQFYDNPNVKMVDIAGSGFNTILLPWSLKYGDEFRFEGREDFVYQVGKVFGPADSGSGRLTQTGSIEVHFNHDLPVSASTSYFNLDHFAIRRYINDPAQILMEGFAPVNSSAPYIVRPEHVVPELNKTIDEFILDLTQKGLIP